jgi:two-component system, cell cycle sensor histidine kinase and response regulator CckA
MANTAAKAARRSPESQADFRTQLLAHKTHLIGELAGAIDNHFNNFMMAVTSYAEVELKKAPPTEKRNLEQLLRSAGNATHLIQKLLAFSRHRTPSPQRLQLNEVITGITELLQQLAGQQTDLVFSLQPDLRKIQADRVEMEELLLSLAVEARNSMSGKGQLSITTKSVELSWEDLQAEKKPGAYVMLAVYTPPDPSPNRSQRSKSGENGSRTEGGFAQATIEKIVRDAQGFTRAAGEPEQASNFNIYFPAAGDEVPATDEDLSPKSLSSSRTILVVDDDDAVRIPATEFLKMEGFKVLQAKNGPEAINIALQKRSPLDLLITDVVMPAMNGREIAKELVEMHPGLKVLYMSGDASEANQQSQDDVLQKPFRLDKLNEKIRSMLGEPRV